MVFDFLDGLIDCICLNKVVLTKVINIIKKVKHFIVSTSLVKTMSECTSSCQTYDLLLIRKKKSVNYNGCLQEIVDIE